MNYGDPVYVDRNGHASEFLTVSGHAKKVEMEQAGRQAASQGRSGAGASRNKCKGSIGRAVQIAISEPVKTDGLARQIVIVRARWRPLNPHCRSRADQINLNGLVQNKASAPERRKVWLTKWTSNDVPSGHLIWGNCCIDFPILVIQIKAFGGSFLGK